jgi:hypothetical protein
MENIWEHIYNVTIPGGTKALGFALDAPPFGRITRLVVKQKDTSNLQGFSVRLFDRPVIALQPDGSPPDQTPIEIAQIMPTISASAGAAAVYVTDEMGYAYRNMISGKLNQPTRKIYIQIDQSSTPTQATNWIIGIVITSHQ